MAYGLLLVLLACAGGVLGHKHDSENDAPQYNASLNALELAESVLLGHSVLREPKITDPKYHYLLLLDVLEETVKQYLKTCPQNNTKGLLDLADTVLPEAMRDPLLPSKKLKAFVDLLVEKTAVGAQLIHDTCDNGYPECDYVVQLVANEDPDKYGQSLKLVLDLHDVSLLYLDLEPKLKKAADDYATVRLIYNDVSELSNLCLDLAKVLKDNLVYPSDDSQC